MDWRVPTGRTFPVAEPFDGPHRLDTGLRRKKFVNRTLPFGLQVVAFGPRAVDTLPGQLGRGHWRIFGQFALFLEQGGELVVRFFLALRVEDFSSVRNFS